MCQTNLSYPRGELDTVDVDPLADVFAEKLPVIDAAVSPNLRSGSDIYYHGTVSSDEGDFSDSEDGSIEDRERNTLVDWCDSAFRIGFSAFPSDADDPQPTVAFSDKLLSDEVLADTPVSVHEEMPLLALQVFTDEGVPFVPPVIDQPV